MESTGASYSQIEIFAFYLYVTTPPRTGFGAGRFYRENSDPDQAGLDRQKNRQSSHLAIEKPDAEIEVSGEQDPNQVGDLQARRDAVRLPERQRHLQNQNPERDQP